jgi:16S rRNA (adenine1518-N6/adenine1519-N6)-dimethyltransferase
MGPAARAPHPPRRKRFGQHFLHDPAVIARIVATLAPRDGDHLVEIGPGRGALTQQLLACSGCTLDAIEIDRDLAAQLAGRFVAAPRCALHVGDALQFDFSALARSRGGRLRVAGNLPYNISTPLLFHLSRCEASLRDLTVMLQREVVQRMAAAPATPQYGRLTVMLQTRFHIERLFTVPAGAFRPAPKVESAVARLAPLGAARPRVLDEALFAAIVAAAFGQRRKTLRNALQHWAAPRDLEQAGVAPGARGETLAVGDFVRLANALA